MFYGLGKGRPVDTIRSMRLKEAGSLLLKYCILYTYEEELEAIRNQMVCWSPKKSRIKAAYWVLEIKCNEIFFAHL